MSKLSRMRLSGIRSFGPEEEDVQNIKFSSPVTLFLGQNGCGKTTIIEALKFAITGDLPGGAKNGQGFIYDPQMAKSIETRGQVKVKIYDVKNQSVTVSKMAKVKQLRESLSYKLVDTVISRGDTNISAKCAEVHMEMCLALGVSKAILKYVIFCHQEESHWPLDESKKLKEKFDDIFDATKYNKSIDCILKTKKKRAENLKVISAKMEHCKENKIQMEKMKSNLQEKEEKLQKLNDNLETIKNLLQPMEKKHEDVCIMEGDIYKIQTEMELKINQLKNLREQQQEILSNTKEFFGLDEELDEKISTFETNLQSTQKEIDKFDQKKQEIKHAENKLAANINKEQMKLGQLQAEEEHNETRIKSRNTLIDNSIKEFNISVVSKSDTDSIIQQLVQHSVTSKAESVKLEKQLELKEKELQVEIDDYRTNHAKLKQNIDSKNDHLVELKSELQQLQRKLNDINLSDGELQIIDNRLTRNEKDIATLEAQVNVDALKTQIETEYDRYNSLEERRTKVENEIQVLQNFSSLQAELDFQSESLLKTQSEMQKLKNKHESDFEHIFSKTIPENNLRGAVEIYLKKQVQLITDLNNRINDKQREVTKLETNLSNEKEKLSLMECEMKKNGQLINNHFQGQTFEKAEFDLHNSIELLQRDKGSYSSSKYIYQKYIEQFKKDSPCCPICNVQVKNKKDVNIIIEDIQKKIRGVPEKLTQIQKELDETQKKYSKILELKPSYEKMQELQKSEIPNLKKSISDLETKLKNNSTDLSSLRTNILTPQKNQELANSLMSDVTLIDQYSKNKKQVECEITLITSKIPKHESHRSMQDALCEQDSLKSEAKQSRCNEELLRKKLSNHNDRLQTQKDLRNNLVAKKLSIKKDLQGKDQLKIKLNELESKRDILENELLEARANIEPCKIKLAEAVNNFDESKKDHKTKMDEIQTRLNRYTKNLEDITTLQYSINDYTVKNIASQLQSVNEKINKFNEEQDKYSQIKIGVIKSIEELKEQINNRKLYYRELQDNVKLREKRKQAKLLEGEIEKYKTKLGNNDIKKILVEKRKLEQKITMLYDETSRAEGKKTELIEIIKDAKKDLANPTYANAALNYKSKLLEFDILTKAVDDLNQFAKAMDWAMLQYHKQQMVNINQTIRDLWRSIYRGNDIDYIELKTEQTKGTSTGRRIYEYKLVQVKNDVQLEMRGRCSAGQKVLASLIIRMALADTFSSKCGILALDEPTTNLDKENIASLSGALVELIARKKRQKNFQLLVITHDQEFLERLSRAERIEQYYLVSRNANGKSVITMQQSSF